MKCPAIIKESTIYTSVFYKDIQQARKDTNTNPSEAQIKAENYKKGTFLWNGLTIHIENPKGSTRSGTSPDGKKWSIKMKYDYGYIGQTEGKDKDAVDIFIGDHPDSQIVYVIDQMFNGKFDEHKCVIGALDEEEARKTYLANYEKGWKGLGSIKALTVEQFKEWVKSGNTRKAINKQKLFKVGEFIKCPMMIKIAYIKAKEFPKIIKDNCLDFSWDNKKVWGISAPVGKMRVSKLIWQLNIPFWHSQSKKYTITPNQVLKNPKKFKQHYKRIKNADLKYPMEVMKNQKGQWEILDGLHRFAKAYSLKEREVDVRKIPRSEIKNIIK